MVLNWAFWLRMHHHDPQWEQHVIKEGLWKELNFARWEHLKSWNQLATITVIYTTNISLLQTSEVRGTK